MANQEREVELLQNFRRYHGGISRFSLGVIWVWGFVMAIRIPIGNSVGMAIGHAVGANALLLALSAQGWSNGCFFALWRYQIMSDVLDEKTLSLLNMSLGSSR